MISRKTQEASKQPKISQEDLKLAQKGLATHLKLLRNFFRNQSFFDFFHFLATSCSQLFQIPKNFENFRIFQNQVLSLSLTYLCKMRPKWLKWRRPIASNDLKQNRSSTGLNLAGNSRKVKNPKIWLFDDSRILPDSNLWTYNFLSPSFRTCSFRWSNSQTLNCSYWRAWAIAKCQKSAWGVLTHQKTMISRKTQEAPK